jgi:para-nitrobenzyl esterase
MRSFFLYPVALCAALPLLAVDQPVRVENGLVSGTVGITSDVQVFKGIPYATPPVGDLRWRAPKPAQKWEGVRKADQFGATCMQTPYPEGSPYRTAPEPVSEDCLYLNIWTGAKSPKEGRPVMVWIHGGAFTRGAGSNAVYDGEELAKKGVVLVTINYRLGIFGFLAHPELTKESDRNSSGNYGILDQIAALEWVQKNIQAFGGDPKRVTIFGESAGSWAVNLLVATPLAKGLFQRAIGESGANFAMLPKLADAEQTGVRIAKAMGADSIAALRAKSAAELLKAGGQAARPNVDGWMLPDQVFAIFAKGKQNDVPTLIGSNADEGTAFTPASVKEDAFKEQARTRFGDQAEQYLSIYPARSDEQAHASAAAAMRDQTFGWEMRTWARMQAKTGKSKVYLYYFSRVPPGPVGKRLGAYHASEIRYVFDNLRNTQADDIDRTIADDMSSYWVNFATHGDPNGKHVPKWPAYTEKNDVAMGFGEEHIETTQLPNKPGLDFFDAYFQRQRR